MRLHRTLCLLPLTVFVLFLTSLAHADFQPGLKKPKVCGRYGGMDKWLAPAMQGHAVAQFCMGWEWETKVQDYRVAASWYRKAAEQGHAAAQVSLGFLYEQGKDVPQDYLQAANWYRKSAAQGDAIAQWMLGAVYEYGQSVPQNYVQAHMWYNLAAAQGQEEAVTARDKIGTEMTPEQIAEAQRLAREWLAQHQK